MANGEVTISFDGINLDPCLKQGLELTGHAICPHCKLPYTYRIHVNRKDKMGKFTETMVDDKPVTALVPDNYDVIIEFASHKCTPEVQNASPEPEESDGPCQPCNRCTARCPKLGYK